MTVLDALTPRISAAVLLIWFAARRRKKGGRLPRDPLAELFLDHSDDEEGM